MSIKHVLAAFEAQVGNPLRKLVLVKLADNANDKGVCWPSYGNIADHCECSRKSVMNHIAALEKQGYLSIERRPGEKGNSSNKYYLTIEKGGVKLSPSPSENNSPSLVKESGHPSESLTPASENNSPPPSENNSPRTCHSLEPVKEPTNEPKGGALNKFELPSWIDKETWKQFEKHRAKIKKPMTDHAKNLAVQTLDKLTQKGYDANKLINHAILKCWQGFYEPSIDERQNCLVKDFQVTTTDENIENKVW